MKGDGMIARQPVAQRLPFRMPICLAQRRLFRRLRMLCDHRVYAGYVLNHPLAHTAAEYRLPLIRLPGMDMHRPQAGEIHLRPAVQKLDGLVIRPGETFSFWRTVGRPDSGKCFRPKAFRRNVPLSSVTGGNLCQMGSLLFWMFLHTPLDIVESHCQSSDFSPDDRAVPFGTGIGLTYNFRDLRVFNGTSATYQLHVWLDGDSLRGRLFSDREPPFTYHLFECDARFIRREDGIHRQNRICRDTIDKATGMVITSEQMMLSDSPVRYDMEDARLSAPVLLTESENTSPPPPDKNRSVLPPPA